MKIHEYNEMMRYLTRPASPSMDQESRIMAKDGYPNLNSERKITDYIEPNIKAQTGSSTPVPGVDIDQESYEYILKLKLPLDEKLKLIAEFGGNKSRTEVDDSKLASRYGVEKDADIYKGGSSNKKFGAEYTNDGLTIGGRYDPDSDDTNFYISKKFQDGGVVEREGFGDGSVTKVQKKSKNVTGKNLKLFNEGKLHHLRIGKIKKTFFGTKEELNKIFKNRSKPGGKTVDPESLTYKEGFGTKAQLIEKLKEKGIKVSNSTSANRFSKTFNIPFEKNPYQKSFNIYDLTSLDNPDLVKKIQKAQVLSGAATPEAVKEFRLSGTDEAGNKVTTNKRRQSAILNNEGLGSKSSFIPKKTTAQVLGHAGDIFDNEKITADDLVYTDKRLNSKLQSIDFQIRKIKDTKLEIQNSNISNIEKRKLLEQADSELIDLVSKSDGFKNVQLTDGTKFGTTRYNMDPTDLFPGSSEKQITDFMKQYFYYSNPRGKNFGKIKPKFLNKKGKLLEDLSGKVKDEIYHGLLFEKNRKASLKAAKNFPKKKIETLIQNIGCKTGQRVTKENGGSCYTDGLKKIKENKLNNNEFNILRKAVNSSSVQTAIKYGGKALKGLGAVVTPIVLYDTYDQYKKGKPLAEIIEYGLIGTSGSREIRKIANYTPEEREAYFKKKQDERNEEDISGLSIDLDLSTNLSDSEVSELAATGSKRVEDLMLAQDKAKEKQRVYTGAPEIEDYGERVGFKLGTPKKLYNLGKKILKNKEPENPDRRDFLKGAGSLGLAITAFGTGALKLAKTLKTKAALKVLAEPAVGQPAWFAPLVDKIFTKGIRLEKDGKKLNKYVLEEDGKTITLETSPITNRGNFDYILPSSSKNSIKINVKGGGAYDDPFDIQYYQTIDKTTGKTKASLEVLESRPYRFGPDADEVELSEEIFKGSDLLELPKGGSGILSDMEGLEKIATGKIKNTKLANTRMKVRDELNQPDNYRSRYNPGEEDRMTRSTGPDGGEYYENLDGEDYYSVKMERIRNSERNDLDPDIDYD